MPFQSIHHGHAADLVYPKVMADERVLEFIDQTLEALIENPSNGGGYHAAETQVFRLLEVRHALVKPQNPRERADDVQNRYLATLEKEHPGDTRLPLYVRVGYNPKLWSSFLRKFAAQIKLDAVWPPRQVVISESGPHSALRSIDGGLTRTVDVERSV